MTDPRQYSKDWAAELARDYTNLLDERLGSRALACSDEWFAECANLVKPAEPIFRQGHFVPTGQWMDGWESRRSVRRRARVTEGVDHDWCILRLGSPGTVAAVDVQTTHFTGNAPEAAAIDGCWCDGEPDSDTEWFELLSPQATAADSHNLFKLASPRPLTHLRLRIYPDGGVARLRAFGHAQVGPQDFVDGELVDLASILHGGRGVSCSDMFYSSASNLLMPLPGINMGDGWETRRRRDAGNDWCIIRLGLTGSIRKVLLDTAHFKGNYPDSFRLMACLSEDDPAVDDPRWQPIITDQPLYPDRQHRYIRELIADSSAHFSHVKLDIFPDGGVSRLRVLGTPDWSAVAGPGEGSV